MNDYTKPPLGAAPAYIRCCARIKELADAISRTSEEGVLYPGHMAMWAHEIISQITIMREMECLEHEPYGKTEREKT